MKNSSVKKTTSTGPVGNSSQLRPVGELMEELGFNPQAAASAKASFIKYLAKSAYNVDLEVPQIYKEGSSAGSLDALIKKETDSEQLSFNLEEYKKAE